MIKYFEREVRPLINPEKENIVLRALQNIIISSDFKSRYVGKLGRKQILKEENLAPFLANVFLYTLAVPNNVKEGEDFARSLNEETLSSLASNTVKSSSYVPISEPQILPEQLLLPLLMGGRCLSCGKSLIQRDNEGEFFQSQQVVELTTTSNGQVVEISLCPNCATKYSQLNQKQKNELIRAFFQAKKTAQIPFYITDNEKTNNLIAMTIKTLHDSNRLSDTPQKYDPSEVEEKIKNAIIQDKISSYVANHYYYVNDILNNMATANMITATKMGKVMRRLYEDVEESLNCKGTDIPMQEAVFEGMVTEVHARSHQLSRTVCEWLIAYFIQGCAIFDAISK
ncbi:hypothetical protein HMPREF9162_1672 [Selenomonas sp. oral taxon 137 str. F0430]|uniref:ABC-three component system protein n=1 Tax=Selenomonas sp. oral taxon 137 TaxID=712531 RepID=UPI0001EB29BE|nr:ABC-three component system protein [Selenomonas sp. oral taxon 137]EFR41133.1 hypothetical protein HMPREF9162_1672 [Selenomonas sp. oral taxon 137 str. F0430]